jgi:hypothetical protein
MRHALLNARAGAGLFAAQGFHGVYGCGTLGRQESCNQRNGSEHRCCSQELRS